MHTDDMHRAVYVDSDGRFQLVHMASDRHAGGRPYVAGSGTRSGTSRRADGEHVLPVRRKQQRALRAFVRSALLVAALALPATAVAALPADPDFGPGGPRLVAKHDALRAQAARAGHDVRSKYRPHWTWAATRARATRYWQLLHPELMEQRRLHARFPFPDWWPAYGQRVASCESGSDPTKNTGNGFYGKWQFTLGTWRAVGGSGYPHHASEREQDYRAYRLYTASWGGAGHWPICGRWFGA